MKSPSRCSAATAASLPSDQHCGAGSQLLSNDASLRRSLRAEHRTSPFQREMLIRRVDSPAS